MGKDKKEFSIGSLLDAAAIQDSLLQSYRNFHLTMQSIFVAVGGGLTVAFIEQDDFLKSILIFIINAVVIFCSVKALYRIKQVIMSRSEDVSFWHRLIIREEEKNKNCVERYFTKFKTYQDDKERFRKSKIHDIIIDESNLDKLVPYSDGFTRGKVDGLLFNLFKFIWITLSLIMVFRLGFIVCNTFYNISTQKLYILFF